MKFSEKIVYMRKKRGISQDRLAKKMGVSRQTIYKWEADLNTPEFNKIERLAEILDISYDLLLDDNIDLEEHFKSSEERENESEAENTDVAPVDSEDITSQKQKKNNTYRINIFIIIAVAVAIIAIISALIVIGIVNGKDTDTDSSILTDTDTGTAIDSDTDTDINIPEVRVAFDVNGGVMANIMLSLNKGDKISMLPAPTREKHAFLGWFTEDGIEVCEGDTVDKSITLIAKWAQNQAIVRFEPLGGTVSETERLVAYGEKIGKLPIPTKENSNFLYWHFNEIKVNENTIIDSGVVLYAKWEEITDKIIIELNANGGSVDVKTIEAQNGDYIYNILPTPVHSEGLPFLGWFDENGIKICEPTKIFKSTTLIAYYGELPICPYTGGEHYFSGWNYDRLEATCTQNGYAHRYCFNCYLDDYQITQNALGHNFSPWSYEIMRHKRQCDRCLKEEVVDYINISNQVEETIPWGDVWNYYNYVNSYNGDWIEEVGTFCSGGGEFAIDFVLKEPTQVDLVFVKCNGDDEYTFSVLYEGDTEYTEISADIPFSKDKALRYYVNGVITKARIYLPGSKEYISWQEVALAIIPHNEEAE